MIKFEQMGDHRKGYALGVAYNTRVKTVWIMFWFFMVVIGEKNDKTDC